MHKQVYAMWSNVGWDQKINGDRGMEFCWSGVVVLRDANLHDVPGAVSLFDVTLYDVPSFQLASPFDAVRPIQ